MRKHKTIGCWLLLCLSAGWIFAQTPEQADTTIGEMDLGEVVITGQFAPTDSRNALHEVRIIKSQEISQQGFNNLSEVLTNQLNLRVNTDPILGNGLRIQGIGGENIQIMIDGVPIIGRLNGNIDLSQIQLQNVDRIEIIEGAMSAQFGSNASGGVINIITKKAQANRVQVESQNQYENIGIWNNSLAIGVQMNRLYANLQASRFHSQFAPVDSLRLFETFTLPSGDTYRGRVYPWNPKLQYGLDGTLRYRLSDSTNFTYQYRYFDEELTIFGEQRRPQFRPYAIDETFQTLRQDHSFNIESYFGQGWYLNSTTAFNVYDRTSQSIRLDFEPDTTSLVAGQQDTSIFTALLHRSILSSNSNKTFSGQLGVEMLHETGSGQRIIDSTSLPLNQAILSNYAAWISGRYRPNNTLTLQANLRYGYNTKYKHPLIPSFHANWRPNKQWTIKASYARGFRAPSLKELHFNFIDINHFIIGNPELEAEYSHNATLITTHDRKLDDKQSLSLTGKLFYNHINNRIVLAAFSQLQFNYQNIETYQTHGFNLRLRYRFQDHVTVKSGLAYTRLFNVWSDESETPTFVPLTEWQNEFHVTIPLIETKLFLTHRFIGQQIQFFTNAEDDIEQGSIGEYHLINATLSKDFWQKRVFIAVGGKNLLDTQAVPLVGSGGGAHSGGGGSQLIGWGRTWFVRVQLRLGKI